MTNDEWIAKLGTLPPQHRVSIEVVMERLTTVLNGYIERLMDMEREIARLRQRVEGDERGHE
jgi:hypothetical protein